VTASLYIPVHIRSGNYVYFLPPPALEVTGDSSNTHQGLPAVAQPPALLPRTPHNGAQVFTGTAKCY